MNAALSRIAAIARVETLRLLRARMTFTLLIAVPALQLILFGYAIRPGAGVVTVAIAAPSSAAARPLADALARVPDIVVVDPALAQGGAAQAVDAHRALIGIEVPRTRSFANPFEPRHPLRIIVDASNAQLVAVAIPQLEAAYWRELAVRGDVADTGPGLAIERRFNATLRADWSFLPPLVGVVVMISMVMLGTLSLARERESGTWHMLAAMPFSALEVALGKLTPFVVVGTAQGLLVLALAHVVFGVPMRGDIAALALILPVFSAAHLAVGYAVAMRAATQLAALQGAVAFYLPAMLLSGFLYPVETLPPWARMLGQVFPLTHWVAAARGATLRGDGAGPILIAGVPICLFLGAAVILSAIARPGK